jgi:hypothetical protein
LTLTLLHTAAQTSKMGGAVASRYPGPDLAKAQSVTMSGPAHHLDFGSTGSVQVHEGL